MKQKAIRLGIRFCRQLQFLNVQCLELDLKLIRPKSNPSLAKISALCQPQSRPGQPLLGLVLALAYCG